MRQDFDAANEILPSIEEEHRTRVAQFLEKQGFKEQALAGTVHYLLFWLGGKYATFSNSYFTYIDF